MRHNSKPSSSFQDYTYKPQRWTGFLTGVKEESLNFKQVMSDIKKNKDKSNADYQKFAKESFNSIHRIPSRNNDQTQKISRPSSSSIRRQNRYKTTKSSIRRKSINTLHTQEQQTSPFEFDIRVSNHDRWPKRPSSAHRILKPTKLQDYPDLERPKDIVCVLGTPLDPLVPL